LAGGFPSGVDPSPRQKDKELIGGQPAGHFVMGFGTGSSQAFFGLFRSLKRVVEQK
jgi:hypothetical protein